MTILGYQKEQIFNARNNNHETGNINFNFFSSMSSKDKLTMDSGLMNYNCKKILNHTANPRHCILLDHIDQWLCLWKCVRRPALRTFYTKDSDRVLIGKINICILAKLDLLQDPFPIHSVALWLILNLYSSDWVIDPYSICLWRAM